MDLSERLYTAAIYLFHSSLLFQLLGDYNLLLAIFFTVTLSAEEVCSTTSSTDISETATLMSSP